MKRKQIGGLIIAVILFIVTGVSSVLTNTFSERLIEKNMAQILADSAEFQPPSEDYIAVVKVVGTIQEQMTTGVFNADMGYQHNTTLEYIESLMYDSDNQGIDRKSVV